MTRYQVIATNKHTGERHPANGRTFATRRGAENAAAAIRAALPGSAFTYTVWPS